MTWFEPRELSPEERGVVEFLLEPAYPGVEELRVQLVRLPRLPDQRGGRDFVRTLMGAWQANGCMTQARHRALDAHLNQQRGPHQRARPGSYAWPELRRRLEAHYAKGAPPLEPKAVGAHPCDRCTPAPPAAAPSNAGTPNAAGSTARRNAAGAEFAGLASPAVRAAPAAAR